MAALGVLKFPDVFHAAVARAAVTDWRQYDTIYTERYMRTPQENEAGYNAGSCIPLAHQLKGKLLIMHGMVDDNVHPTNAWALIDALDKADKSYECRFFPNAQHGFGGSETQWEFLYRHLVAN
jgi:dipeptidyl-peptidase-4